MKKSSPFIAALVIVLSTSAFAAAAVAPPAATAAAAGKSVANLQAALNGESSARERYLAFAKKADEEGYGAVGSLFRAAARAEGIHATNHAAVIKKLGGDATAKVDAPVVKSTRENLEAAIKGETYERDTMYPGFLSDARAEGNKDALQTLNYAKTAEAEHARLYSDALTNLAQLEGKAGITYYVCTVCGFTTPKVDFAKCPSCFSPKEKYEAVA